MQVKRGREGGSNGALEGEALFSKVEERVADKEEELIADEGIEGVQRDTGVEREEEESLQERVTLILSYSC